MLHAMLLSSTAWQPATVLSAQRSAPITRSSTPRCAIVLPELADISLAQAIAPVFLIGPTVQMGYAIETGIKRRLGVPLPGGFFYDIVKSDAVQKGPQMKRLKKEKPKLGGKKLAPEALEIVATFRGDYSQKELEVVWGALLKVYGTKERALDACRNNPQILNPAYSFCNTILESKKVLRSVMEEEEALEVMRLNPAVLQCGPSLEVLGKDEIKSIAMFRSMGNTVLPAPVRTGALALFIASILFSVASAQTDDAQVAALAATVRPVLGAGLASVLAFVLYGSANAQRSVKDAVAKQNARRV